MTNKFKIKPLKVVNKVADLLVINVNTQLFSRKVQGIISLEAAYIEPPLFPPIGEQIYSEQFFMEYIDGDIDEDTEELVKVTAAKQLGVTLL